MMLFNNSIEFDEARDEHLERIPIPMKKTIFLKDIWIPEDLLPNRKRALDCDVQPSAYRILQKPDVKDKFSVYSEEPKAVVNTITADSFVMGKQDKTFTPEYNDFNTPVQIDSSDKVSENNSSLLSMEDVSADDDEDNKSSCPKQSQNAYSYPLVAPSIQNPGLIPYRPNTLVSAISIENFEDEIDLKIEKNRPKDKQMESDSRAIKAKHKETQQMFNETKSKYQFKLPEVLNPSTGPLIRCDVNDKLDEIKQEEEFLEEMPTIYKRPVLQEDTVKNRTRKEKKSKKNGKTNLAPYFLQKPDDEEEPENNEFYHHLVRNSFIPHRVQVNCPSEFPILQQQSPIEFIGNSSTKGYQEADDSVSHLTFKGIGKALGSEYQSPTSEKHEAEELEVNVERPKLITIMVENISKSHRKEDIESIFESYEGYRQMSLISCGKFWTAEIDFYSSDDIDWRIECLNDSQPLGDCGHNWKCYKLKEEPDE